MKSIQSAPVSRPLGVPHGATFVLLDRRDSDRPVVRGVFSSLDDVRAAADDLITEEALSRWHVELDDERTCYFDPEQHALVLEPVASNDDDEDLDAMATAQFVVLAEGERYDTELFVWDSERKWALYRPLKLYWCTTSDGDEDWFIVAHSGREAALLHAEGEGYDYADASAEFVLTLPEELQQQGESLVGWPSHAVLLACGARFLREKTPRSVELGGRTFVEGMLQHEIDRLHDDQAESRGLGRPHGTRRGGEPDYSGFQ